MIRGVRLSHRLWTRDFYRGNGGGPGFVQRGGVGRFPGGDMLGVNAWGQVPQRHILALARAWGGSEWHGIMLGWTRLLALAREPEGGTQGLAD